MLCSIYQQQNYFKMLNKLDGSVVVDRNYLVFAIKSIQCAREHFKIYLKSYNFIYLSFLSSIINAVDGNL